MGQVQDWFSANSSGTGAMADRLHPEQFSHDLMHGNIVWDLPMKVFSVFWITMASWWSTEVLRAIGVCTVAGAVSKWYWYKEGQTREGHKFPIWGSFKRVIKYHFGSMAFGAAVLRIAQIWLAVLAYLTERMKRLDEAGGTVQMAAKVARCCLKCVICLIEKFIKYLTSSAYVIIAIQGGTFCGATKRAFVLMRSQIRLGLMTEFAGGVLISLITLSIALICACISYLTLKFSNEIPNWIFEAVGLTSVTEINSVVLPVIVTFLFAYIVSEAFFDVLETAIDTIFICYCADIKLNKKEGQLARNMLALDEIKAADEEAYAEEEESRIRREKARGKARQRARAADANETKAGKVKPSGSAGGDKKKSKADFGGLVKGSSPNTKVRTTKDKHRSKLVI